MYCDWLVLLVLVVSTLLCIISELQAEPPSIDPSGARDLMRYAWLQQRGWLLQAQKAEKKPKKEKKIKKEKAFKPKVKKVKMLDQPEVFSKSEKKRLNKRLMPKLDFQPRGNVPVPPSAGKVNSNIKAQILNGRDAEVGQFPWQVALIMDESSFCGGSLILNKWALTAAHCAFGVTSFKILVGVTILSSNQSGVVVLVSTEKYVHRSYDEKKIKNDIALVKLPIQVEPTPNLSINMVRLPRISDATLTFENTVVVVSGWGIIADDSSDVSDKLKYVDMIISPLTVCLAVYGKDYVLGSNICCDVVAGKTTCSGDSGGALVYRETDQRWTQLGIVSYGTADGCASGPAAFTRVSSYLGWISEITGLAILP